VFVFCDNVASVANNLLQELLQQLVESGRVGCRVLSVGESLYTVYWLKAQQGIYACRVYTTAPTLPRAKAAPCPLEVRLCALTYLFALTLTCIDPHEVNANKYCYSMYCGLQ